MYLLTPEKKKEFKLKVVIPLSIIRTVSYPKNNKCLFKIGSNGLVADQLLESFRRSKLVLFLRDAVKSIGCNVRVEIGNNISVLNRHNKTQVFSSTYNPLLRPEFQEMFRISEKVGYLKRIRHGHSSVSETAYLCILCDMGLLLLDTSKFEFKAFVPLLGTKLKNTSIMRTEVKGGGVYSIDVILSASTDRETLIFASEADKQEWTTKILKIQEKSIGV